MNEPNCPSCNGTQANYLGQLGNLHHFQCRGCGCQFHEQEQCRYCGGNCPHEPEDSENLCDGFAGDIDGLYNEDTNED